MREPVTKINLEGKVFYPGLIATAAVPVSILTCFFLQLIPIYSASGDSGGVAFLAWIVFGVVVVPAGFVSAIPCLIYILERHHLNFFKSAPKMIVLSGVFALIELFILGVLLADFSDGTGIVICIGFLYYVLNIYSLVSVYTAKERIISNNL